MSPQTTSAHSRQPRGRRKSSIVASCRNASSNRPKGDERVDVAQLVRRVVSGEAGRGYRRDALGGAIVGRRDQFRRKRVFDPAGLEGDRRRGRIDVLAIGRTGDQRSSPSPPRSCGSSGSGWRRKPRLAPWRGRRSPDRRSRARDIRNCARRSRRNSRPSSCTTACCSPRG